MRNIKILMEYDGSRYQGWQRLGKDESNNTISNKLVEIIKKMTGEDVELFCGSRTEVGVHAYGQVANFKTASDMSVQDIKQYLNRYLPMDIAILDVEEKPERFHASLNAYSRIYLYRIAVNDVPSVFTRKYAYYSFKKPNLTTMKQAAAKLLGTHDFKGFSTVKRSKSTEKEILNIKISETNDEVQITIEATDFLHNMSRMIVSTLLDIGLNKRKLEELDAILDPKSAILGSAPADPKGLYLREIIYK